MTAGFFFLPLLRGLFKLCRTWHIFFLNFFQLFSLKKVNVLRFMFLLLTLHLTWKTFCSEKCWCFCSARAYKYILCSPSLGGWFSFFVLDWNWPGFTTFHSCSYHCYVRFFQDYLFNPDLLPCHSAPQPVSRSPLGMALQYCRHVAKIDVLLLTCCPLPQQGITCTLSYFKFCHFSHNTP